MVAGFQHLRVNNGREKPQALFPLTESPLTPTRSASSVDLDATPAGSPATHLGTGFLYQTARRSPLGRNVVTALEAELDQVPQSRAALQGPPRRVSKQEPEAIKLTASIDLAGTSTHRFLPLVCFETRGSGV